MNSFKAFMIKEVREGIRTSRFIVMALGIIFFAILDPVMVRLTPLIMKASTGVDLSSLFEVSSSQALLQYIGDLYQLTTIIFTIGLCSLSSGEIKNKQLIIPLCTGLKVQEIFPAKMIVYSLFSLIMLLVSNFIFIQYSKIILPGEIPLKQIIPLSLNFWLYYSFIIALILLLGSWTSLNIITIAGVLLSTFALPPLLNLLNISRFSPMFMVTALLENPARPLSSFSYSYLASITGILLMVFLSSLILEKKELA